MAFYRSPLVASAFPIAAVSDRIDSAKNAAQAKVNSAKAQVNSAVADVKDAAKASTRFTNNASLFFAKISRICLPVSGWRENYETYAL